MKIFILVGDQEQGPYSRSEVFALLKDGKINAAASGRLEGQTEWKTLNQVLTSGTVSFLTPEQIAKQQEDIPETNIFVPDFNPRREDARPEPEPQPEGNKVLLWTGIATAFAVCFLVWFFHSNPEDGEQPAVATLPSQTPNQLGSGKMPTAATNSPAAEKSHLEQANSTPSTPAPAGVTQTSQEIAKSIPAAEKPEIIPNPPSPEKHSPEISHREISSRAPNPTAQTSPPAESVAPEIVMAPSITTLTPVPAPILTQPEPTPANTPNNASVSKIVSDDFFSISAINYSRKPSPKGLGIFNESHDKNNRQVSTFVPSLEVKLKTKSDILAPATQVRAYFFDSQGSQISVQEPTPIRRGGVEKFSLPTAFKKETIESVFFAIPETLKKTSGWKALIVFGDSYSACSKVYPYGNPYEFDFPEKQIVEHPKQVDRRETLQPVVEYVVKIRNKPQFTLFLKCPTRVTKGSQAKGVLALSALGHRVEDIRHRLEVGGINDDLTWVLQFAEKHDLVILCWGAKGLWDPQKNWDEMDEGARKRIDDSFEQTATAWAQGVETLTKRYGLPDRNFFLYGSSAGAQFAARLALREPQFFQAVQLHIPSSFDRPTKEASHVLWCLTTGEEESGYERSLKFYAQCREMGYPIIYKAIMQLGHSGSLYANQLAEAFFEWALQEREQQEKLKADASTLLVRKNSASPQQPQLYTNPPYVGDVLNQEIFPWSERAMVPERLQVPLPNKNIADAWSAQKL
jgi:predicted esterase